MDVTQQITSGTYAFSGPSWNDISNSAKNFIRRCMMVDPNQRMTVREALHHNWMKDCRLEEKYKKIIENDPSSRLYQLQSQQPPTQHSMIKTCNSCHSSCDFSWKFCVSCGYLLQATGIQPDRQINENLSPPHFLIFPDLPQSSSNPISRASSAKSSMLWKSSPRSPGSLGLMTTSPRSLQSPALMKSRKVGDLSNKTEQNESNLSK
eukprot:TRINITY_DN10647_c0_g1_i1.p1 TRINITY_DN10647_c0_g1~~TRINITY_DN10647_c0_g1_i1.p1  ORF type:complete len:207 (+),score=39.97 TRINITY_DN10647_c0_g1_i1:390-1010(+)